MATVQLQHISKVYTDRAPGKGVAAVRDFNLDIADKEFIVLVGPSGCGKTTTLRMIAGLEEISEGRLLIDGKLMNNVQSGPVILGVRPEHIQTGKRGVEARIKVSEMMGSSVHLHATASGRETVIIVPFNGEKNLYNTSDVVHFTFDGSVVHLFSRETGHNLEY